MDILQLQETANMMPTPQLAQMVNNPNSPIPPFLALAVLAERKKNAMAGNAMQAQQQAAKPTVAQQVTQGVVGLPTGGAIPQRYAHGGIVAFGDGGDVDMYGMPIGYDAGYQNPLAIETNMARNQANAYRQAGRLPEAIAIEQQLAQAQAPRGASAENWSNVAAGFSGAVPQRPATPTAIIPPTNRSAGRGIRALMPGESGGTPNKYPDFSDPRVGAAERMTDAEWEQRLATQKEQITKLYGADVAQQYVDQIRGEREALKGRYQTNKDEAILRAGLAMLGGRSKWGAINIGEGGIQGLNAYQAGRASLDEQGRKLRSEEMAAALTGQQRKDQILGAALTRADRDKAERSDQRREDIGVNQARTEHEINRAGFGLKERAVAADEMRARASMIQASEYAKANNDARLMNAITTIEREAMARAEKAVIGSFGGGMLDENQRAQKTRELYYLYLGDLQRTNPVYQGYLQKQGTGGTSASRFGLDK